MVSHTLNHIPTKVRDIVESHESENGENHIHTAILLKGIKNNFN